MGRNVEDLRLQAQRYRDTAEKGPRRKRAFHLTQAYCLERQAGILERQSQDVLPGLFDQPNRRSAFDDSLALRFKPRFPRRLPSAHDVTPGLWQRAVGRLKDGIDDAGDGSETGLSDPLSLRPL